MKTIALLRPLLEVGVLVVALLVGLRVLTGWFGGRQKAYQLTFQRQLALLFWPLLSLSVGLPFLVSLLVTGIASPYELVLLGLVCTVVLGFAAPALLLHLHYYVHNFATTVVFEPKQNLLAVYQQGKLLPFRRTDLRRVVYGRCSSRRWFWSSYEYVQLHLHDGQVITLTSLLLPLAPLADFLRNTHLETRWQLFCIIRL